MGISRKPRVMLSISDDSMELLRRLETHTKLSPAQTIQYLFPAHLPELYAYLEWLEQLPEESSLQRDFGPFLIHNYGPEGLISAIKRVDPTYQTEADKFAAGLKN